MSPSCSPAKEKIGKNSVNVFLLLLEFPWAILDIVREDRQPHDRINPREKQSYARQAILPATMVAKGPPRKLRLLKGVLRERLGDSAAR